MTPNFGPCLIHSAKTGPPELSHLFFDRVRGQCWYSGSKGRGAQRWPRTQTEKRWGISEGPVFVESAKRLEYSSGKSIVVLKINELFIGIGVILCFPLFWKFLNRFSRFLNFKILTISRAYYLKSFQLIALSMCLLFHLILHQRIHQIRHDSDWLLKRNQLEMRFHRFISEWTQNSRFYTEAFVILYYF